MDYPASYYAASRNPRRTGRRWRGSGRVEVCIVGAGFTGLSAGIELAERGHEVVVPGGARVGWGASGRNGGQIVNGLNAGLETIGRRYGKATADFVATVVQEGGRIIRERVARYGIACDLKDGQPLHRVHRQADEASSRRSRRSGGATGSTTSRCWTGRGCGGTWRATPMPGGCSTARAGTCTP